MKFSSCAHSAWRSVKCCSLRDLEILAGQLAHLQQEPQIAALHGGAAAGPLKDFDHAGRFVGRLQRAQHQQEVGRVAAFFVVARAGVRAPPACLRRW